MGGGRWSTQNWTDYATRSYGTADRSQLRSSAKATISNSSMDPDLDPTNAKDLMRESRDSDDNPASTAIALFTDVTGSMGFLSKEILVGMETVCTELYARRPVTDPHILTGAVGDGFSDRAPIQLTQFEADIRIVDQLRKLYIEGNGGGNGGESYALPWLFASRMTSTDCWEKRGEKGFLFTVGDEPLHGAQGIMSSDRGKPGVGVTREQAKRFLGIDIEADLSAEQIFDEVSQRWEVVHVCVGTSIYKDRVRASFEPILGDRLLFLEDPTALPELIVSTIQVIRGDDANKVAASWSGTTAVAVADALKNVTSVPAVGAGATSGGIAAL